MIAPRVGRGVTQGINMRLLATLSLSMALIGPALALPIQPEALSKCLTTSGMKFYTAWWCPYCKAQLKTLSDAGVQADIVACFPEGSMQKNALCTEQGVKYLPTWEHSSGKRTLGAQSLESLAELSGCSK